MFDLKRLEEMNKSKDRDTFSDKQQEFIKERAQAAENDKKK